MALALTGHHNIHAGEFGENKGVCLISRFSIALLSGHLLAAGFGSCLPSDLAELAFIAGAIGLSGYSVCSLNANRNERKREQRIQQRTESRLGTLMNQSQSG
jgi:hypothetical protein